MRLRVAKWPCIQACMHSAREGPITRIQVSDGGSCKLRWYVCVSVCMHALTCFEYCSVWCGVVCVRCCCRWGARSHRERMCLYGIFFWVYRGN